jgi:hypothetical protein
MEFNNTVRVRERTPTRMEGRKKQRFTGLPGKKRMNGQLTLGCDPACPLVPIRQAERAPVSLSYTVGGQE